MQGALAPVASYTPVIGQVLRYTHEDYQPPAYLMTVESLGPGQGRSTFVIQAVNCTDTQTYWCKVTLMSGVSNIDSVSITISGMNMQYTIRDQFCTEYDYIISCASITRKFVYTLFTIMF